LTSSVVPGGDIYCVPSLSFPNFNFFVFCFLVRCGIRAILGRSSCPPVVGRGTSIVFYVSARNGIGFYREDLWWEVSLWLLLLGLYEQLSLNVACEPPVVASYHVIDAPHVSKARRSPEAPAH